MLVLTSPARCQVCITIKCRIPSRSHGDERIKKLSCEFNQIGFEIISFRAVLKLRRARWGDDLAVPGSVSDNLLPYTQHIP
jgi:hypothetical protein